jgi:hypothetical protein
MGTEPGPDVTRWKIVITKERFDALKKKEQFWGLVALGRAVNELRFAGGPSFRVLCGRVGFHNSQPLGFLISSSLHADLNYQVNHARESGWGASAAEAGLLAWPFTALFGFPLGFARGFGKTGQALEAVPFPLCSPRGSCIGPFGRLRAGSSLGIARVASDSAASG